MKISDDNYYSNYTILPVSSDFITAIDSVDTTRLVTKVNYINILGVTSDSPSQGVNIVVTKFNDGTSVVSKLVK